MSNIRNKILVTFYLEDGCNQDDDEVLTSWWLINFKIYSELFIDMINDAIQEWLSENRVEHNKTYEVIFAHVIEHDVGAVHTEYFEPIFTETQQH